MKCERCNAYVSGKNKTCPLCQNKMIDTGENQESVFPPIQLASKKEKLFIKILSLILFAGTVFCVMANLTINPEVIWSPFVAGGALCLWLTLILALKSRRHIPKAIFWIILFIAALAVIWDFSTGFHKWSIDYIIPILFSGAIIIIAVVATILKIAINDYIVYILSNSILGIIPLVFILTGILNVTIPSMICVSFSIISLAGLFIFDRYRLVDELKRRTHI